MYVYGLFKHPTDRLCLPVHLQYRNEFCGCPVGEKITSEPQFVHGVCCPNITCGPIACNFDNMDYVAGEAVPTTDPCEISW